MSADNYYTVKMHPETFDFHVCMGFMSSLEEGIPSFIVPMSKGYNYDEAWGIALLGVSEYGVIQEPEDLRVITNVDEWRAYLEETIRVSQDHLDWLNMEGEYGDAA